MSNNKQSSVEWIINQIQDNMGDIPLDIQEQAKAMHKDEIENAYISNSMIRTRSKAEEYYNETFNTKEK